MVERGDAECKATGVALHLRRVAPPGCPFIPFPRSSSRVAVAVRGVRLVRDEEKSTGQKCYDAARM